MKKQNYGSAIREGFEYLLSQHPDVFVLGQGLWSPWYVGNSMTDLDQKFGKGRVIDTPVSESACTAAALGASVSGTRPIILHPRMDFMLYAMDAIVNQAAKWSFMFGGNIHPRLTVRSIINRGGEQGAQHSQALHSWFAHIPGLRVVMPSRVQDARDMLVASVLCDDPVIYIDDRWLYELEEEISEEVNVEPLASYSPQVIKSGNQITIVGSGYTTQLCLDAEKVLEEKGISCEIVDMRVLNPFDATVVSRSVSKTGRLLAVDGGWQTCGIGSEIIASVLESIELKLLKTAPKRISLGNSPAPTSSKLEDDYYPSVQDIVSSATQLVRKPSLHGQQDTVF